MTAKITGMRFALLYVDELGPCQAFYEKYLGFKKEEDMQPGEIFGSASGMGIWIGSGYKENAERPDQRKRATFMLGVESAHEFFAELQKGDVPLFQDKPVDMGGQFWFQFADPAGNIIDVLGK